MRGAWMTIGLVLLVMTGEVAAAGPPPSTTGPGAPSVVEGQQAAAPAQAVLTHEQMEAFLINARITGVRRAGDGVTNSQRATLTDGTLTHDAHIQTVDEARAIFETPRGTELNFKDTYRYNIAGYRLARLLGMDNVPVSVERNVSGRPCAVTWWVDDVMMDEGDRQRKKVTDPNPQRMTGYVYLQRAFDELVQNVDRNLGNIVYSSDWKMWLIDHTRAFRLGKELRKPEQLGRIERSFFENLKTLTTESVTQAVGPSLAREEVAAVLARRDLLVKVFEDKIAASSEAAVLYTLAR